MSTRSAIRSPKTTDVLKVVAQVEGLNVLFCGLDRENTTRLHDGRPIVVELLELIASMPEDSTIDRLVVFAGETLEDCRRELGHFLPLPES